MKKINHPPFYLVAKEEILNYIQTYGQKNGAKLPPEKELTKKLDISRGTLRKAMRLLEKGGFIRRKQGIGTIICMNKYIINSTHDINEGVSEMIQGKGMIPGSLNATIKEIRVSKKLAEQLDLDIGNPVVSLARIRHGRRHSSNIHRRLSSATSYLSQKTVSPKSKLAQSMPTLRVKWALN